MKIRCGVCVHHHELDGKQTGFYRARKNTGERIIPVNYGKIASLALDPIEEKPLAMFCPGTMILLTGSFGCNLRCPFYQNHEVSMAGEGESETAYVEPGRLVARAQALRLQEDVGAVYTYNEPLVGWEYVRDTVRFIRAAGMKNVIVTNASVTGPILDEIPSLTDVMNIGLKGFADQFYIKLDGDLGTVWYSIQWAAETCHVELTTLTVPGENDSEQEIKGLASWVDGISSDTLLHIARLFPRWKVINRGATDIRTVYSLAEAARKSSKHVFIGNC